MTARLISKYSPTCPIIMVTRTSAAARYSHLSRGVYPFHYPEQKPDFNNVIWQEDVDKRLKWGMDQAKGLGILENGSTVIAVQGWKGGLGHTNT
jgi:pyruvate kinase